MKVITDSLPTDENLKNLQQELGIKKMDIELLKAKTPLSRRFIWFNHQKIVILDDSLSKFKPLKAYKADIVIITSDNPRSEDPNEIINDVLNGIKGKNNYQIEVNREEAIRRGLEMSHEGDIILVCGKGHETYQEVNGVRKHFDDQEIIMKNVELTKN